MLRAITVSFLLMPVLCYGQIIKTQPTRYVVDRANVISADIERSLNGILQELEQKAQVQYIVLTLLTTQNMSIDEFAVKQFETWGLGRQKQDNGFLFVLAMQDQKYRFEVGYGLEGIITDQFSGYVGREVLVPYMRQDQVSQGVYQANLQIVQKLAERHGVTLSGMPNLPRDPAPRRGRRRTMPCCSGLPFLLFFLLFMGGGRGGGMWLMLPFMMGGGFGHHRGYGGYGGSGSYGGGSFGGGFGGFGGGMGGGSGGGGASGGW